MNSENANRNRMNAGRKGSDMVKEILENGMAILSCPECGKEFNAPYDVGDDPSWAELLKKAYDAVYCQECSDKYKAELKAEEERKRKAELADVAEMRMENSGIPLNFRNMEDPYVRHAAVWVYRNRANNLLIGGKTGTGKTSSACYVAKFLLNEGKYVKYYSRRKLTAEYINAKCDSNVNGGELFLYRLGGNDLVIVDELVGKKGTSAMTATEQELYFSLIDGVYSGEIGCKLWIIGNFYEGAIKALFDDPDPVERRLNENFKIATVKETTVEEKEKI